MDADEWLFLDLVEPHVNHETNEVEWTCLERGGLRIHRSFFRGKPTKPENCRVMVTRSNTMEPFIYDGDWFVVDTEMKGFSNGITAFIRDDDDYYVTRVRRMPDGGIRLSDGNSASPPFDFPPGAAEKALRILGGVIYRTTAPTYQYQLS